MASCSDFAHSSAAESGSSVREVPHCWIMQVCAKDEKWYTWEEWQGYYGEYAEKLWDEAIAQGDFKSDSSIRPTATACAVPTNAATKQISHDEEKRGPQVAELWVSRYRTTELIAADRACIQEEDLDSHLGRGIPARFLEVPAQPPNEY